MLKVGDFEIHSIVTGTMRLDGGAMFGVVPKVLWQRKQDIDDQNRILLATRTLLAINRRAGAVILTDTGTGSKWPSDEAERYGIRPDPDAIGRKLGALGLSEDHVTDVIVTHLHFDHNGGVTVYADESCTATRLRFPNARHWMHRRHWDHAYRPTLKDRASFLKRDFEVLEDTKTLILVDDAEMRTPCEGMSWFVSEGHTCAQLLPVFHGEGGPLAFTGDVIPTLAHLPPPWVMAYDLYPLTTIDEKLTLYDRCRREGLKLAFPHDPAIAMVELMGETDKPIVAQAWEE